MDPGYDHYNYYGDSQKHIAYYLTSCSSMRRPVKPHKEEYVANQPQVSEETMERVQDTAFEGLARRRSTSQQSPTLHSTNATSLEKCSLFILSQIYTFVRDFSFERHKNTLYLLGLVAVGILCSCVLVCWEESQSSNFNGKVSDTELSRFLLKNGLQRYQFQFYKAGYAFVEDLIWVNEDDLQSEVGIELGAHRRRLKQKAQEVINHRQRYFDFISYSFIFVGCWWVCLFVAILGFVACSQEVRKRVGICATTLLVMAYHRVCLWQQMWELLVSQPSGNGEQVGEVQLFDDDDERERVDQQHIEHDGHHVSVHSQNLEGIVENGQHSVQGGDYDQVYLQNGAMVPEISDQSSSRLVIRSRRRRGFGRYFRRGSL
eukprot:TRINITY_DN1878_c0_g2_i4.p1 TRINITY_DN1878_c0_g2~~TRINITY_DN1878_c0_g2_i4.p1  ORF type:complete len:386 (+),score=32.78 TRINITY_DN1878_c0_g2_i4:38-1159(+)